MQRAPGRRGAGRVLGAALGVCLLPAAATAGDRVVFMGDSLVDNQNSYLMTSRAFGAAFTTPASPPYYQGRFSDGPNWTDRIAPQQLYYADYYLSSAECLTENATVAGSGACRSQYDPGAQPAVSLSFAFGGAQSGSQVLLNPPGFLTVLEDLRQYNAAGRVADLRGSVFALWVGGNDYSNYAAAGGGDNAAVVNQTLGNIQAGLTTIASMGARRAVVFNIFDLSRIPTFAAVLGTSGAQLAETVATMHNAALPARLAAVRAATGLDVVLVDVDALYNDIFASPARYGFTNLTQGCISETLAATGACPTAAAEAATLYWDGTHPTTTAHGYIAELYEATLQAVDQDGGRLAAIPDAALLQAQSAVRAVRAQLDDWRAGTAASAGASRSSGVAPAGLSLFAAAANEFGKRDARGAFAGYKYENRGGVAGVEYRLQDVPAVVGAHAGAVALNADIRGGGDFDSHAWLFGLFAGVRSGAASITAQVTGSRLDADGIERDTGFSVLPTARGATKGWGVAGEIEARWDFAATAFGRPLWIVPLARLSAASSRIDGFAEQGAQFLNLAVEDSDLSRVRGGLGVNVWTEIPAGGTSVTPFLTATWERNLSSPDWSVAARLPSGQAVAARGGHGAEQAFTGDAGVRLDLGGGAALDVQVSASLGRGADEGFVLPLIRFRKML